MVVLVFNILVCCFSTISFVFWTTTTTTATLYCVHVRRVKGILVGAWPPTVHHQRTAIFQNAFDF
jgi:hypothetical protein